MDEIEQRLRDATDSCIKAHEVWRKDPKESQARGDLMEAVHELRKVSSRLEIDVAISERDEMTRKPIPIPHHRSSQKNHHNNHEDQVGNRQNNAGNSGPSGDTKSHQPRRRKSSGTRKASD